MVNTFDLDPGMLLDSMPQGVYVTDLDRRIRYWSRAAERLTGWSAGEIVGRGCYDNTLCHMDLEGRRLCGEELCPLHRSIVTGQSSTVPIIVFAQHRDGRRVPLRVSVAPIRDGDGRVVGGIEVFQDMSIEYADMRRGRNIQASSMVNEAAGDARIQTRVHYAPHDVIGGDFYAISRLDENRYGLILADVSGHGLSAALYTMHLASLWDDQKHLVTEPAACARAINHRLMQLLHDDGSFATGVCGVIDLSRRIVKLASAGGPPPLLYGPDGHRAIDITGHPLGLTGDPEFAEASLELQPAQRLLLFTDGVVEVEQGDGEQVGDDGLARLLAEARYPNQALSLERLEEALLEQSNRIQFDDDLTIIEVGLA